MDSLEDYMFAKLTEYIQRERLKGMEDNYIMDLLMNAGHERAILLKAFLKTGEPYDDSCDNLPAIISGIGGVIILHRKDGSTDRVEEIKRYSIEETDDEDIEFQYEKEAEERRWKDWEQRLHGIPAKLSAIEEIDLTDVTSVASDGEMRGLSDFKIDAIAKLIIKRLEEGDNRAGHMWETFAEIGHDDDEIGKAFMIAAKTYFKADKGFFLSNLWKRKKPSAKERLERLNKGYCPVHGVPMQQARGSHIHSDGAKSYMIVSCSHGNCAVQAKAYGQNGPWELVQGWKFLCA
ncbi:MAG: hypothetical protein IPM39_25485 [Chloroflexi bacterium]|nr:hypothetical protein [Chloroflexota bacterium]